jgi:hypothetical protein
MEKKITGGILVGIGLVLLILGNSASVINGVIGSTRQGFLAMFLLFVVGVGLVIWGLAKFFGKDG